MHTKQSFERARGQTFQNELIVTQFNDPDDHPPRILRIARRKLRKRKVGGIGCFRLRMPVADLLNQSISADPLGGKLREFSPSSG